MMLTNHLKSIVPQHDYPAGLIHPYWARKPINIVEEIIKYFSNDGDVIYDPFMGSGTTLFAALKSNRSAIGSDLNPLACLIVQAVIDCRSEFDWIEEEFFKATQELSAYSLALNELVDGRCVERETYNVTGEYVEGNFKISPNTYKVKPIKNKLLKGKIQYEKEVVFKNDIASKYLTFPIDFEQVLFTENTRIAVHSGVNASHFFTPRNIIFINMALEYVNESVSSVKAQNLLRVFISSLLPMLRLSDKKASSQWPYWRPKQQLTSRNPIVAISKRENAFRDMFLWVKANLDTQATAKVIQSSAILSAQNLSRSVDLIVTDPPYADHAPYLEYSELFWSLISGSSTKCFWKDEIVKTNAEGRQRDSAEYEERMRETFCALIKRLKIGGRLVFFYVDKNLYHWDAIKTALHTSCCVIEEVVPLSKQRRSMKTVTSPGRTLDGDIIIVCKRIEPSDYKKIQRSSLTMEEALSLVDVAGSYFERFAKFLSVYLTNDISDSADWKLNDISRIV